MYLGTFDSFRFTAAAATPCDSIVNAGEFYGVTKANVEAGEEGLRLHHHRLPPRPGPHHVQRPHSVGPPGHGGDA